jgi:glycine/D-amino acid oxidase-like deaminating enzyme
MLIERSELTSGSTWHAAGGFHTLNGDTNMAALQGYTIRLYKELEAITGMSCGSAPCRRRHAGRQHGPVRAAEGRTRQAPLHGAGYREMSPAEESTS